jgi:prophage maintenance system killer protein
MPPFHQPKLQTKPSQTSQNKPQCFSMVKKGSNIQQEFSSNTQPKPPTKYTDTRQRLMAYQHLFTRLREYDEKGAEVDINTGNFKKLSLVKEETKQESQIQDYLMFINLSYRIIDFDILKKELDNPYWLSDIDICNQTLFSTFVPIYKKVYQNINGQDVYPNFVQKSFALFYHLIKDKPLKVGNKRYACFMFDWHFNLTIEPFVLTKDIFDNLFYLATFAEKHTEEETLKLCNFAFNSKA